MYRYLDFIIKEKIKKFIIQKILENTEYIFKENKYQNINIKMKMYQNKKTCKSNFDK